MNSTNTVIGVAGLPLDRWERDVFMSFFPDATPEQYKRGGTPYRYHDWGDTWTFELTWVAIAFLGMGAATFFKSFLEALGTEMGKSLVQRWINRGKAEEEKLVEKNRMSTPTEAVVVIYQHESDIPFLIMLPHPDDKFFERLKELPVSIEDWLSAANIGPDDTQVVVCHYTAGWRFDRRTKIDEKNYALELESYKNKLED